jgi:tetratricopeptide (TPR) repeat protein
LQEPDAVSLFLERSQLEPSGEIAELCRRLDSLPLAVELAAARTKALSPEQILERLSQRLDLFRGGRDADARQQTLRATTAWSYDLLAEEEQRLIQALSVFAGGCTLEAAEEVGGADLDTLQSLVEKSLLRFTDERYWMLETIREFTAERLEESGEADELRRRHAEYFLAVAEEAEPHVRGDAEEWFDLLDRELNNLRAALDRLKAVGEKERVLRLAGALARFWALRGHLGEGRRHLEAALAVDSPSPARARALTGAAVIAVIVGDRATARLHAEEALELHSLLEDAWGAAYSELMLGHCAAEDSAFAEARQRFDASRQRFSDLGDEHYSLLATSNLALALGELGDIKQSSALHEESLRWARRLHKESIAAESLAGLAGYAIDEGRLEDAVAMLTKTLGIHRELGYAHEIALDLGRFAAVLALDGRAGTAARLLSGSQALIEELGATVGWWAAARTDRTLRAIRTQLDEAAFAEEWERGRTLTAEEAIALALDALN